MSQQLETLINNQINLEQHASSKYLAMSAWFETTPYSGFAAWMRKQSDEETEHAMKFFDYVNSRGNTVRLQALDKPQESWDSALDAFRTSLESEQLVSRRIREIYEFAMNEKDFETLNFLNWFLEEQIEEEENAQDYIDRLELAGDHVSALMRLDREAGKEADS